MLHREEEVELNGTACTVTGTAVYEVEIESDFSRDVGGVDGLTVTQCELLYFDLDGYRLPREAVEVIVGKECVSRMEDRVSESIQSGIHDYAEAA